MPDTFDDGADDRGPDLIEGTARVVAVEGGVAWLEPEQGGSCGGCTLACGAKGIGTVANRLAARRFPLADHPGLRVGERVAIGVRGDALLKAAGTAYGIPLITLFAAGGLAQWASGSDALTLAASLAGLAVGLAIARIGAWWLFARGTVAPRFLRRISVGRTCDLP
jgi:sigma-E factor negative regulatory protein RseC